MVSMILTEIIILKDINQQEAPKYQVAFDKKP